MDKINESFCEKDDSDHNPEATELFKCAPKIPDKLVNYRLNYIIFKRKTCNNSYFRMPLANTPKEYSSPLSHSLSLTSREHFHLIWFILIS